MIEPVNFIEKELFVLSYRKMGIIGGSVVGFLFLVYGVLLVQNQLRLVKVDRLLEEVNQLKAQREKILAVFQEEQKDGVPGGEEVKKSFLKAPHWSLVLKAMTRVMPAGLWLVSIKSYQKEEASGGRGLILTGEAEDARQVSLFLEKLTGVKSFERPILSTSKQEQRGSGKVYTFTIDSGIGSKSKGGGS